MESRELRKQTPGAKKVRERFTRSDGSFEAFLDPNSLDGPSPDGQDGAD
jgi:hypothetical protein